MQALPEQESQLDLTKIAITVNELIRNLSAIDPAVNPNVGKVAPSSQLLRAGKIAYADNTNWNPGYGAGYYLYTGSAWKKITHLAYESAEQTITSAGALTLAHGAGVKPTLVQAWLVCQTGEYNYSAGDEVAVSVNHDSSAALNDFGVSVVRDVTNLNIRFGSNATVFMALNKTTGAGVGLTNANWKIKFLAWV